MAPSTDAILYLAVTFLNFPPNHNASLLFSERCVCRFWALTVPSWDAGLLRRRWDAAARCEALVAYWDHLQHIFHTFQNPQDLEHLAPATTILMDAPPPLGKTHSYFFILWTKNLRHKSHLSEIQISWFTILLSRCGLVQVRWKVGVEGNTDRRIKRIFLAGFNLDDAEDIRLKNPNSMKNGQISTLEHF